MYLIIKFINYLEEGITYRVEIHKDYLFYEMNLTLLSRAKSNAWNPKI